MPIVFDEIESEVTPERGAQSGEPAAPAATSEGPAMVELIMRELELARERRQRLIAD